MAITIESFKKALNYRKGGFEKWCYDKIKALAEKSDALAEESDALTVRVAALEAEIHKIDAYVVTGTVQKDASTKIEGATVKFTLTTDSTKVYTGTTAADGTYTIENIPNGLYAVTATATGYQDYTRESNKQVRKDDTVDITMVEAS